MSDRSFRAVMAAVVVVGIASSCGTGSPGPEWGVEAEMYDDALTDSLNRQGPVGWLPFVSDDVVLDERSIRHSASIYEGVDDAVLWAPFFRLKQGEIIWTNDRPMFLDRSGSAATGSLDLTVLGVDEAEMSLAIVRPSIDAGRIEVEVRLETSDEWRSDPWRVASVADAADSLAVRWATAWSDSQAHSVRPLYGPAAVLEDSMSDLNVRGSDAISVQHGFSAETTWTVAALGDGLAVFPFSAVTNEFSGVGFVVDGEDGNGCPGEQLIWLAVDEDGLIDRERRFWGVEDARRCRPDDARPTGWWTGLPIPESGSPPYEDLERTTGTVIVADQETEIRNGTPVLQSLTEWALARFDWAGMKLPAVDAVTFTRFSDYCTDVRGRAIPEGRDGPTGWNVVMCFDETYVCRDLECEIYDLAAKRTILHELAHVWMADNLADEQRTAFIEMRGLDTWDDREEPWNERAEEQAAELITWGLLDTPFALLELGRPPIEERLAGFQLLTGRQPLQPVLG